MTMDLGLTGKVALITGASRGLGRAMAEALGREGAKLSICARNGGALEKTAAQLESAGMEVVACALDVTQAAAARKWVEQTVTTFGGVDVLVNNAGGARPGAFAQLPDSAWRESFDLNFFAPVALSKMCAAEMEKRGEGSIVNIGSIYGREAGGPLTYNASKAALISFTKMLAREYAPKNIRVNTIAPGSILAPGGNWERRFRRS